MYAIRCLETKSHIHLSRKTPAEGYALHLRNTVQTIYKRFHLRVIPCVETKGIQALATGIQRPMHHVAQLRLHQDGHRDKYHRNSILEYDEHLAEHHLTAPAECATHNVNRSKTGCKQRRSNACQSADKHNGKSIGGHRACRQAQRYRNIHPGIARICSHVQQQLIHNRQKRPGEQQRQRKADRREQDGFSDVFPDDGTLRRAK